MKKTNIRRLSLAAMMGAIAFVFLFVNFSIPVISPFAEFDAAALPELIGGFVLGPIGAVEIILVKLLLKIVIVGTESMYTGELQNLILSFAFVLPAVIFYRRHRTKKGAVIGLVIGSLCKIVVGVFTNMFIIFPFYIELYGMNWDAIIGMCSALIPAIHDIPTVVLFSIVPFNVLSRTLSSVITILVYKKISVPLKKIAAQ